MIFEELDARQTRLGELSLRRRGDAQLGGRVIHEVKLGDDFLMSSLFTAGEEALARLGLAAVAPDRPLHVVVGGLGLGHTAVTALGDPRVAELYVVEALAEVIDWHRRGLLPCADRLTGDERVRFVQGDFFALASSAGPGFDAQRPGRRFDAVLLDVDHSPRHWLHPANAAFYAAPGLLALRERLLADGVFALWSNEATDDAFLARLRGAFASAEAHRVVFENPYTGGEAANTVYVARC